MKGLTRRYTDINKNIFPFFTKFPGLRVYLSSETRRLSSTPSIVTPFTIPTLTRAMMPPIITPTVSSSSLSSDTTLITRSLSTSSVQSLAEALASASTSSNPFLQTETDTNPVTVEGLRHVKISLEPRKYKTPNFTLKLVECLRALHVPSWTNPHIIPDDVAIQKVSGSLTNAIFFVSYPSLSGVRTLLLRIYGSSSGSLISRPRELYTLHALSSQYRIGPRVYGTFENGRVEEYFESNTLTPADIRTPEISRWIGARMAELHSVDIASVEMSSLNTTGKEKRWKTGAKKNVTSWVGPAQEVLALPSVSDALRSELNLTRFCEDWLKYLSWLAKVDDVNGGSKRVFAHNDAQYGNLLKLKHLKEGLEEHRQIIVVDFEYASPNPASYDIANHFHEWTANYHSPTPHILDPSLYPDLSQRRNFYIAYLQHTNIFGGRSNVGDAELERRIQLLDQQVRYWSPASHAVWVVWGIVQAREDIEGGITEPEFDYISYAKGRMAAFRREIRALGVI